MKKIEKFKCHLQNYWLNKRCSLENIVQTTFNKIFDNILTNLQARFVSLNKFEFLSLIDSNIQTT